MSHHTEDREGNDYFTSKLSSIKHAIFKLYQANHYHFLSNILYTQPLWPQLRDACQLEKEKLFNISSIFILYL